MGHVGRLSVLVAVLAASVSPAAASTVWETGDVFVGVGSYPDAAGGGVYQVRSPDGVLKESLPAGNSPTGCAFNPAKDRLYGTFFFEDAVKIFEVPTPHTQLDAIDVSAFGTEAPESIVFAANGDFYVGNAGIPPIGSSEDDVLKFDSAGNFVRRFDVPRENRGSDWIELSSDQRTLFYTSEGRRILRYDVVTDTPLPDFATLPGPADGQSFALRLLPPGDGSGGLLVADTTNIKRLDAAGNVVQTYDTGDAFITWFSLNLDPNGTSFWAADLGNLTTETVLARFNIETGAVEVGPIVVHDLLQAGGVCIMGEPTAALPPATISLDPTAAENPAGTSHTLTATVARDSTPVGGVDVSFEVTGGPNAGETSDSGECAANADCTTDGGGHVSWTYASGGTPGADTIDACFTDVTGEHCATAIKQWTPVNQPPSCTSVSPSSSLLWPPNHGFRLITLSGATDPDGDPVTLRITGVTQDEPLNDTGDGNTSPDARRGTGGDQVFLRSERTGRRDGRVYRIDFEGSDGQGGTCTGNVTVGVPHDQGQGRTPIDSAPPSYDSFGR